MQQFLTKNQYVPHAPPPSIHLILPWVTFFVSWDVKSTQGKGFADVDEVKQNNTKAEALKDIKIDQFRNWFKQWEKKSW